MKTRRLLRGLRVVLGAFALAATACGQNPETTEKARGVISGANLVLALTIVFVVIAGAMLVGVVGLDRFVRTRKALETAPSPEEVEETDEVVAGIVVGRASVPRWLYAFYVIIPLFALLYVLNNVALRPAAEEKPAASKAPTGPQTETTIVASGIKFDLSKLTLAAGKDVTIEFDNKDAGVPHNFTVWKSQGDAEGGDAGKAVHAGKTITGAAKSTEKFKAPASGSLYFDCTIHPTAMFGTIDVAAG